MKVRPAEFGGGRTRTRPPYSAAGIRRLMCCRAGCDRPAYATWGACADDNMQRPLCAECDVELNWMALEWMGDPDLIEKMRAYEARVEETVGHPLYAAGS